MAKSLDGAIVVEDVYTFKLVSVIWLCFVILGTALIVAGTFGLPLITGRFDTYRTEELFFKKHCEWDGQVESCTSAGVSSTAIRSPFDRNCVLLLTANLADYISFWGNANIVYL